jgi:hypothetical protein
VILTGSVVFIFMHAQTIFAATDAKLQVHQYARHAFDQIERDLANVVPGADMEFFDDRPPPGGRVGRWDPGEELALGDLSPGTYEHAFTVRQPAEYLGTDGLRHRHDSLFFKTVTAAGGGTSAALVEYALEDQDRERPKLVRRVWRITGVDASNPTRPHHQVERTAQDLCLYTTDARFELFLRDRRQEQTGQFHEAGALGLRNAWPLPDRMASTYYDERHDPAATLPDLGVWEGDLFRTQQAFTFPMLREGDRVAMWGGGLPTPRDYTIDSFRRPDGTPLQPGDPPADLRIKFREPAPDRPASLPAGQPLLVSWDASWLPPAVRVTLRIKDAKSLQTRSVQRVFKLLAS